MEDIHTLNDLKSQVIFGYRSKLDSVALLATRLQGDGIAAA